MEATTNDHPAPASEDDALSATLLEDERFMGQLECRYWKLSPHSRWVLRMLGLGMEFDEMHYIYEAKQGRPLARNTLQSCYYRAKHALNFLHPEILPALYDDSSDEEDMDDDTSSSDEDQDNNETPTSSTDHDGLADTEDLTDNDSLTMTDIVNAEPATSSPEGSETSGGYEETEQ
jgi:hypothetical protein